MANTDQKRENPVKSVFKCIQKKSVDAFTESLETGW